MVLLPSKWRPRCWVTLLLLLGYVSARKGIPKVGPMEKDGLRWRRSLSIDSMFVC